jgi:hypothetical protein
MKTTGRARREGRMSLVIACAGVLAFGATACRKSGRPDDVCAVVTKADVAAAFGGTVSEGVSSKDHCKYTVSGKLKSGQTVNAQMGGYVEIAWNKSVMKKDSTIAKLTMEAVPGFENAWWEAPANTLFVQLPRGGEFTYQAEFPLAGQLEPLVQQAQKGKVDPLSIPLLTAQSFAKPLVIDLAKATYARTTP